MNKPVNSSFEAKHPDCQPYASLAQYMMQLPRTMRLYIKAAMKTMAMPVEEGGMSGEKGYIVSLVGQLREDLDLQEKYGCLKKNGSGDPDLPRVWKAPGTIDGICVKLIQEGGSFRFNRAEMMKTVVYLDEFLNLNEQQHGFHRDTSITTEPAARTAVPSPLLRPDVENRSPVPASQNQDITVIPRSETPSKDTATFSEPGYFNKLVMSVQSDQRTKFAEDLRAHARALSTKPCKGPFVFSGTMTPAIRDRNLKSYEAEVLAMEDRIE